MRAVLRWVAIGAGLLLVVTAGLGWASYRKFSGNIHTDRAAEKVLARYAKERPRALVPQARNILMLGSESGQGGQGGQDGQGGPSGSGAHGGQSAERGPGSGAPPGEDTSDAAVLLHLSADRRHAAAVGVPRALKVGVPSCPRPDGGTSPAAYEPFGRAFSGGGAACSIRAFERLSGIRVDHHMVVDLAGFDRIEAAVGAHTGERRRELLRTLTREARGADTLRHPARFFGLVDTATSSLTADPGLSTLPALYELAGSLRKVPDGALVFRTLTARPAESGPLLAALRADRPVPASPSR
ncbi:LCP family protein [Streptomyces sp. NPDC003300]|uniref:LCP family protein n=1 Tax=unclassified Streptomyces TaxID=2593676 RepID=UPI0033A89006